MTSDRAVALQEAVRVQIEKNGQRSDPHMGDLSYAAISTTYKEFLKLLYEPGPEPNVAPANEPRVRAAAGDYLEQEG